MDTDSTITRLAIPTNRTHCGPTIVKDHNRLLIQYDFECDDGDVKNAYLSFKDVIAFQYRDAACCDSDSILDAYELRSKAASEWLSEVVSRWNESVGWQNWQQQCGGPARFKHFTLYFDDAA